jgi:prepilin-type N-terminal cleavage/methylation domain-containing protein
LLRGFSLSELLVSLAIVGTVAALTVPSLMNNVGSGRKQAVLKEVASVLQQINSQGIAEASLVTATYDGANPINLSNWGYIRSKLNTVKDCPTSGVNEGCFAPTSGVMDYHQTNQINGKATVLSNGAALSLGGFGTAAGQLAVLDINNTAPPNRVCLNPTWELTNPCDMYNVWFNFSETIDNYAGYGVDKRQTVRIKYYGPDVAGFG